MAAETIVARATAPGKGGVAIVRLSGPQSAEIVEQIAGNLPPPRQASLRTFKAQTGEPIDSGLLLFFPAPNSYTGEDVGELQCHGGPVVVDMLISRAIALGARMAMPGEFSHRAFLNNRLDLAQAEAVADLIDAASEQAVRSAQRVLQGDFSARIEGLINQLTDLRVYVEAALDFPDEEVDFLADSSCHQQLEQLLESVLVLIQSSQQGQLLRDGVKAVISGPANVGKSTLLNALAGGQRAIVTEIAGTTRDLIAETLLIEGLPLHIIDTAGLRQSDDPVELAGIALAEQAVKTADLLLIVGADGVSAQQQEPVDKLIATLPPQIKKIYITNKIDTNNQSAQSHREGDKVTVYISAKTGEGLDLLRTEIVKAAGFSPDTEGLFIARRRHLDALSRCAQALNAGKQALLDTGSGELLAEELRTAQRATGEITGEFTSEDLLGAIFSGFCIGK